LDVLVGHDFRNREKEQLEIGVAVLRDRSEA
jgi:hypothetical protein